MLVDSSLMSTSFFGCIHFHQSCGIQLLMSLHSIFSESMGFSDLKGSGALKSPFSHPTRWTCLAAIVKRSGAVTSQDSAFA